MTMHFKHIGFVAIILGSAFASFAQEVNNEDFSVHFRLSSSDLQNGFDNNGRELNGIIDYFKLVNSSDTIKLNEVTFFGSTSPEGSYQYNRRLATQRRDSLEHAVTSKVQIPAELIKLDDNYMDWDILARELSESNEPWKAKALEIIARPAKIVPFYGDLTIDARVLALIRLDMGRAWPVLRQKYFPAMRMAGLVVNTTTVAPQPVEVEIIEIETPDENISEVIIDTPQEEVIVEETAEVVPVIEKLSTCNYVPRFTISSNATAWVLMIGNLGVEIDICRHLSLAVPVYYSTMNYFTRKIKFRTFSTQPELRYWFRCGNDGWYINAHFGVGSYNVAWNGKTRYQDYNNDTPAIGGGLGFGYRLNLSKNGRWKVEFGAGVGVYKAKYDMFVNEANGPYYGTGKKTWIGLDQLKATFSYSIPLRKGGDK